VIPFAHVRAYADSVRTVSEDALSRALLLCMERAKLIVEPAGAAAVAALMTSAPELSLHGPDAEPVQPRLRPPPIRD